MMTTKGIAALSKHDMRGSRLRCLLLTEGSAEAVAMRLTNLVHPHALINARQKWMPKGLSQPQEAKLGESPEFLSAAQREEITRWWLEVRLDANTPNWDIASTATIDGRKGLVLVEAKAHDHELAPEDKLRSRREENAARIEAAIGDANVRLNTILPGWELSPNSRYQLSNRFAWSWKIASMGVSVILVYLGFLCAEEMRDLGEPVADAETWVRMVLEHGRGVVPEEAWEKRLSVNGTVFLPLIRSLPLSLD